MLNGKKIIRVGLLGIFGCLFLTGNTYAYTQIDDCYTDRTNASYNGTCRDYNVNESFNTNGATVSYGAYLNTPGNSKTFLYTIEGEYNSKTWRSEYYLLYREDGYVTIFQGLQNLTDNNSSLYIYTGNGKFCIPIDNINVCASASNNANTAYTKTIEEVNSGINNSIMTGYKILYSTTQTANLPYTTTTNAICPMYDNGFIFCMPLRSDSNPAGTVSNMGRYGLGTRTNIFSSQEFTNIYDYINTNYTIGNTQFTYIEPEETTTATTTILGQCPTIREILSTYSSNYNTGICYSATRLLTQTGIVNTEAQSIFELYPTFTGWLEDYNYYRQYCENVPTSVCREAFSGNEIKWSLLNKTPENNPIGVYQYCHLQLNIEDKNATTCVLSTGAYFATGVDEAIEEEIQGNQSVLDIMLNSFNNLKDELPSFNTGTVFDEFLEEGETRKDGFKLDIFKTFLELWSKITSIFIFRHQYDGIIPTYITSIIMIILLFKILKK